MGQLYLCLTSIMLSPPRPVKYHLSPLFQEHCKVIVTQTVFTMSGELRDHYKGTITHRKCCPIHLHGPRLMSGPGFDTSKKMDQSQGLGAAWRKTRKTPNTIFVMIVVYFFKKV